MKPEETKQKLEQAWAKFPQLGKEASLDRTATLACERGTRSVAAREACTCLTCFARFHIFGQKNMGIPNQEMRRAALAEGKIPSLKQPLPKEV